MAQLTVNATQGMQRASSTCKVWSSGNSAARVGKDPRIRSAVWRDQMLWLTCPPRNLVHDGSIAGLLYTCMDSSALASVALLHSDHPIPSQRHRLEGDTDRSRPPLLVPAAGPFFPPPFENAKSLYVQTSISKHSLSQRILTQCRQRQRLCSRFDRLF